MKKAQPTGIDLSGNIGASPRAGLQKFRRLLLSAGILLIIVGGQAQAEDANIVLFNANWCAQCREIDPIVQEVADQNHLPVKEIDVDDQNAPREVKTMGLSIPTKRLPQIYLLSQGKAILLFDGAKTSFGNDIQAIRATLLQRLRQSGIHQAP